MYKPHFFKCENCAGTFRCSPSDARRFCSMGCRRKGEYKTVTRPCEVCGKIASKPPSAVRKRFFCGAKCHGAFSSINRVGEKANHWRGGVVLNTNGYLRISHGPETRKYIHRKVMEQHLGRPLSRDEVVHHINGDKRDNRIENLMVMTNQEHTTLHQSMRGHHGH